MAVAAENRVNALLSSFLRQELRGEKVDAVALTELLLQYCRFQEREFYLSLCDAEKRERRVALYRSYRDAIAEWSEVAVGVDGIISFDVGEVVEVLPDTSSEQLIAARAMAEALDAVLGDKWVGQLRLVRGTDGQPAPEIEVKPGKLIPASWLEYPGLHDDHRLAYNRTNGEDYLDRLSNVRLAHQLGLDVVIDFRLDRHLRQLKEVEARRYAVVSLPAVDYSSLTDQYSIQFNTDTKCFAGVCPRSAYFSNDQLTSIVRYCLKAEADVVICPELCGTRESIDCVREELVNYDGIGPRLVVAGTCHENAGGTSEYSNRLYAFLRVGSGRYADVYPLYHSKLGAFYFRSNEHGKMLEDIRRDRLLRLYCTDGVLVAFLVCKDLLEHSVLDCLRSLGVRQLFVAAFSPETAEFVAHSLHMTVTANTFSAIAMTTTDTQPTAIFSLPVRGGIPVVADNFDTAGAVLFGPALQLGVSSYETVSIQEILQRSSELF